MYFPYLRGRQYELLALQDLIRNQRISRKIIPIIEPVKLSPTLINTIAEYHKSRHQICVIENPAVGSFSREIKSVKTATKEELYKNRFFELMCSDFVTRSAILKNDISIILDSWISMNYDHGKCLLVYNDPEMLSFFERYFSNISPAFTLIPDESSFRRRVHKNKVLLSDNFEKKARNSDYCIEVDEFYSENHLYFLDDGYVGFSDYSVVGEDYQEAGFAPYAVAIHIVYFTNNGVLRIKHFVSETNDDINNPALKFFEAVSKLNEWYQNNKSSIQLTFGLEGFLKHFHDQTYPGLGTVKKLSLMHHIELMSIYLDGKK